MSKGGVLNFSEAFHLVFMLDLKVIFLRYDVVITQWKNLDKEPIKIKKKSPRNAKVESGMEVQRDQLLEEKELVKVIETMKAYDYKMKIVKENPIR
jgi:uncharacterized membrane protein (UPF0127 family)